MDYNWFFSAVAQSFAAIVGIFGAFIISKYLNFEKDIFDFILRAKVLISKCKFFRDKLKIVNYTAMYNKDLQYFQFLVTKWLDGTHEDNHFDIINTYYHYVKYLTYEVLKNDYESYKKDQDKKNYFKNIGFSYDESQKESRNLLTSELINVKEIIRNVKNEWENKRIFLNTKRFLNGFIVFLMAMLLFGVILPLLFLPYQKEIKFLFLQDSSLFPSIILFIVTSIILTGLIIFTNQINRTHSKAKNIIREMEKYTELSYFHQGYENNKGILMEFKNHIKDKPSLQNKYEKLLKEIDIWED
ncbi:MAG: hypothetical protein A2Y33_16075 [Spirochaetes bacterium GWF1_51_8]|nr:MAG: hypothetical protein A2Y33_16075 [Spirochaetes bacterium GWF1_51_8]